MPKKTITKRKKISPAPIHNSYLKQREHFFRSHPRSRLLLGLLIVAFAYYLGQLYYNTKTQGAIGEYLAKEGIFYIPKP